MPSLKRGLLTGLVFRINVPETLMPGEGGHRGWLYRRGVAFREGLLGGLQVVPRVQMLVSQTRGFRVLSTALCMGSRAKDLNPSYGESLSAVK